MHDRSASECVTLVCPHCNQTLRAPRIKVGELATCPKCRTRTPVTAGPGTFQIARDRAEMVLQGQIAKRNMILRNLRITRLNVARLQLSASALSAVNWLCRTCTGALTALGCALIAVTASACVLIVYGALIAPAPPRAFAIVGIPAVGVGLAVFAIVAERLDLQRRVQLSKSNCALERSRLSTLGNTFRETNCLVSAAKADRDARQQEFLVELRREAVNSELGRLLREPWRAMSGIEFETFLARVFRALEFKVDETPATGDHGADLLVAGMGRKYAVQAKGYPSQTTVGNDAVRDAFAAKEYYDCDIAVVVTNSRFTKPAIVAAAKLGCFLFDRDGIEDLITRRRSLWQR